MRRYLIARRSQSTLRPAAGAQTLRRSPSPTDPHLLPRRGNPRRAPAPTAIAEAARRTVTPACACGSGRSAQARDRTAQGGSRAAARQPRGRLLQLPGDRRRTRVACRDRISRRRGPGWAGEGRIGLEQTQAKQPAWPQGDRLLPPSRRHPGGYGSTCRARSRYKRTSTVALGSSLHFRLAPPPPAEQGQVPGQEGSFPPTVARTPQACQPGLRARSRDRQGREELGCEATTQRGHPTQLNPHPSGRRRESRPLGRPRPGTGQCMPREVGQRLAATLLPRSAGRRTGRLLDQCAKAHGMPESLSAVRQGCPPLASDRPTELAGTSSPPFRRRLRPRTRLHIAVGHCGFRLTTSGPKPLHCERWTTWQTLPRGALENQGSL